MGQTNLGQTNQIDKHLIKCLFLFPARDFDWRITMAKEQKSNKEAKKPKAIPGETKKQKKDPKKHDMSMAGLFGNPR